MRYVTQRTTRHNTTHAAYDTRHNTHDKTREAWQIASLEIASPPGTVSQRARQPNPPAASIVETLNGAPESVLASTPVRSNSKKLAPDTAGSSTAAMEPERTTELGKGKGAVGEE